MKQTSKQAGTIFVVAAAVFFTVAGQAVAEELESLSSVEMLPQPEALRSSPFSRESYSPKDVYDNLRLSRRTSGPISTRNARLEDRLRRVLYERQGDAVLGPHRDSSLEEDLLGAASSTGYGGYGSESGYGLTCTSGYVNASAVALLAFLFLLNIVQDVITQITTNRRKRSAGDEMSPLDQFLVDGGVAALYEDLPTVLLPLMVNLADANHSACVQRPLCEANLHLSLTYGPVGRVVGYLVSNMAAKTFSGARALHFDRAMNAAASGRNGSCEKIPVCSSEDTLVDREDLLYRNMNGIEENTMSRTTKGHDKDLEV
ncbi:hypothetical protein FHG87_003430 [Trinorchestia longiramus]|nr:hypothetical protein FHG87_003430 [Trinorchestia longiramus]